MGKVTTTVVKARHYRQIQKFYSSRRQYSVPFPGCDYTPSTYKGDSYEKILSSREKFVTPTQKAWYKKPLLLHEGRAQWVWDHEGRRYLDMFGGIATVSVGHCHPKLVSAMSEQSYKLGHSSPIYMHARYHEYVDKLTSRLPKQLSCVYLTNSGSEATELALQLARVYTGRHDVVSLRNCYHGGTGVATATTAMGTYRFPTTRPPGHVHLMNPDVYKGAWGGSNCRDSPVQAGNRKCNCTQGQCQAEDNYFKDFLSTYQSELPADGGIAAFIAESIQGVGGAVQFPRNYLKRVYAEVRKYGGLCIADEVQTGFGRTGLFWGFEGHDVVPDIVIMAKGIGNGYPLGAVVTRPEVAAALSKAAYFNTYAGNPIACAVGSAVLDVIEEETLRENAGQVGTHLLCNLASLLTEFPEFVGDVRGKGLMIGLELVRDPDTREPLPSKDVAHIFEDVKDEGVLIGLGGIKWNVFRLKPPLCVTKEDADYTVDALRTAFLKYKERNKARKV